MGRSFRGAAIGLSGPMHLFNLIGVLGAAGLFGALENAKVKEAGVDASVRGPSNQ